MSIHDIVNRWNVPINTEVFMKLTQIVIDDYVKENLSELEIEDKFERFIASIHFILRKNGFDINESCFMYNKNETKEQNIQTILRFHFCQTFIMRF